MNLFDLIDREEAKENPDKCEHRQERKTITIWPGENFERMTWTCEACGRIRGRC